MNSKQLGLLGELKAQYDFIKAGWDISIPIGDYCSYDMIVVKNDKTLKIQVKTTETIKDGVIKFSTNSSNYYVDKIYTEHDCDYFYLYCLENEKGYLCPISMPHKSAIWLRTIKPKNGQRNGINFAKDYEFKKVIYNMEM